MITFVGATIITAICWIPTIIRSKNKGETAVFATVTWVLALCAAAATHYLLAL
jgi:preprotein translocase subunit SecY